MKSKSLVMKDLRTERQKLKDEIQCLRNEINLLHDKILDTKIALQKEEHALMKLQGVFPSRYD